MAGIPEVADAIKSREEKIRRTAEEFRQEKELYFPVKTSEINYPVCAVDGGLLAERFHGSDIIMGKAVAVLFDYKDSKLSSCRYLPEKFPVRVLDAKLGLDEHEAMVYASLFRLNMEIKTAIDSVKEFSPRVLLFDGSLLPLPNDMPNKESILFNEYNKIIALYAELYETCRGNCNLIGVIKDARSRRLVNELKIMDENISDSYFTNFLLKKGERTNIFPYAKEETPAVSELKKYGEVFCFYIKPSDIDLPLRVEFVKDNNEERIPEIINSLSAISESYAYPAPLIEADLCAAMDPNEMEKVKSELASLLGTSFRPLRRNSRPFR